MAVPIQHSTLDRLTFCDRLVDGCEMASHIQHAPWDHVASCDQGVMDVKWQWAFSTTLWITSHWDQTVAVAIPPFH